MDDLRDFHRTLKHITKNYHSRSLEFYNVIPRLDSCPTVARWPSPVVASSIQRLDLRETKRKQQLITVSSGPQELTATRQAHYHLKSFRCFHPFNILKDQFLIFQKDWVVRGIFPQITEITENSFITALRIPFILN